MPPAVFPVSSCILSPSLRLLPFWMEADWSPSLAVALSLFILAGVVAKGCPKLWGPSLSHTDSLLVKELGCSGWQEKKPAPGRGLMGMLGSTGALEVPPAAMGVHEMPKPPRGIWPGSLGSLVSAPERSRQSAIRKHSRHQPPLQPSRNALIGLMKAKHTTCNIYKWLIRQRNRSAGLKTLGT